MKEDILDNWQKLLLEHTTNEVWKNLEFGEAAVVEIKEIHEWHYLLGKQLKLMAKDYGVSLRFDHRVDGSYRITLRRFHS